jgi:PAS domain S-box-containing protein
MTDSMPDDTGAPRPHDWYRQVLETAPDAMVIVGADGNILFVNAQTERLFGYQRAELLGQPLDVLIPERLREQHGRHVARFFGKPTLRPMGSGIELFGRRSDAAEIAIEVSLSPVSTGDGMLVSAAIRDISERKRTEAAAKLAADRLASAVESIMDAFALFDAKDRLVLCNSVYRSLIGELLPGPLVGRTREELLDAWLADLAFPGDAERAQFRSDRIARRDAPQETFDVKTRDGRSLRVTDRRTVEGGVVRTIWDLTDDVRLAEELRIARATAEAASAAKSEFLSSMSHELRTPLNAILGFAQLLRRDKKAPLSERHIERVEQILKGGEHLLRLIDDILDLSRIEAGAISLSTEPVSADDVLRHVSSTLEPMAARAGLTLRVDALPEGIPMLAVDRTRFAQVLMNFGSNAIKYNRPGGSVTFSVSLPEPGFVRATVSDTGIGIPADKQERLFQPFQRAGQETGPIEGTGIGLVITKRLTELMGGRVGFRSSAGEGSEFWVEVPVHVAKEQPSAPSVPRTEPAKGVGGPGKHLVLYVEDNPANVLFMKDLLGAFESIDLMTAPTAEMGVELARARTPELIIMDINLPGMSGLDALRALKASPETSAVPVIALTAAASERDRQRGEQAGFFRYLTKPVQVDELERAIAEILEKADARGRAAALSAG